MGGMIRRGDLEGRRVKHRKVVFRDEPELNHAARTACRLLLMGWSQKKIAQRFMVSEGAVSIMLTRPKIKAYLKTLADRIDAEIARMAAASIIADAESLAETRGRRKRRGDLG